MSYLVIVGITPEKRIAKYQEYESESEANAHATRVADTFPNAFVAQVDTDCLVDYMAADVSNKTVTFDQARWDSDQNAIASTQYQRDRQSEYPPMADYLDGIVKNDKKQINQYIDDCLAVKQKYPK
ncbi:MAG TPA: hypothetical protein EYQ21_06630 [Flavobacteriales bacterium]|nr:hypothetical protein [Flavobacteriales bacterium]